MPWTLAAVRAGKHVLCEKPMALRAADLDVLRAYASQVHIAEAFMVRHHPHWIAVCVQLRAGTIGELRCMQLPFSYFNDDPANIRIRSDIGGSALYDIGGYAIVAGRWFFEAEPQRVSAMIDRDPRFGTDPYQLQAEAFSRAVSEQAPDARGLDDAMQNLRIIEALFASAAGAGVQRL